MINFLYDLARDRRKGAFCALVKFLLWILSGIYGLAVRALIFLRTRNQSRLKARVISIGNITLGGTGKTSLVEYLGDFLTRQGRRVAVLSRGYRGLSGQARASGLGADEPQMLRRNLGVPVVVDVDRARGGRRALQDYQADTLILDDGFQQWGIKKDLEIVTIDAQNPFGNRCLLPRGILREPLDSLKRADVFLLTKTNLHPDTQAIKEQLKKWNPRALIADSGHLPKGFYPLGRPGEMMDCREFKGRRVILACGIGDPDSFKSLISLLGLQIAEFFTFPDHHQYTPEDLAGLRQAAGKQGCDTLVITEKDASRLSREMPGLEGLQVLVLKIELKILSHEEAFHQRLLELYRL